MNEEKICPRCGLKYSYIERRRVGSQVYLLSVHYIREGKRRRVKKCYLGPADSYIYVSRTHEFPLKGPVDRNRLLVYLEFILNYIEVRREELSEDTKKQLIERFKKIIRLLKE